MEQERWKQIWEFPTYSVSTFGHIRNDDRMREVKQSLTRDGASKVGLVSDGKQHTRSVARIVLDTFVKNTNARFDTPLHLNGDLSDNRLSNLTWRPRWFVWKYSRQFDNGVSKYVSYGPVVCRETGEEYESPDHAAMTHGLLVFEVVQSAIEMTPVWPDWLIFHWLGEGPDL